MVIYWQWLYAGVVFGNTVEDEIGGECDKTDYN